VREEGLTFPDLDAELDRMFPGWRTWDLPGRKREEKPEATEEDRLREFIRQEEEKMRETT
jgi:hypothetical protein